MRDWTSFVHARLCIGALERRQEIVEELAGHLEDAERNCNQDVQVSNWARFSEEIRRAEEDNMNSRLRSLWIPGLTSGVLATVVLAIMQKAGLRPLVFHGNAQALVFYLPWLIALPPVGAVAAYLSRRAGGSVLARLAAAVFPCLVLLAPMVIVGVVTIVGALFDRERLAFFATLIAQGIGVWIAVPAVFLSLGALPFLRAQKAAEPEQTHPAHA